MKSNGILWEISEKGKDMEEALHIKNMISSKNFIFLILF